MSQVRLMGAALTLAVCLIVPSSLFAQSDNAAISGIVKDATGSSVANANVSARNEATGVERRTTTRETGFFIVTNLPPGFYSIVVEAPGFKKFEQNKTKLDPNITTSVDVAMQVGAVTETVEVTASVANVQSESATLGKLVDAEQIKNMVMNGRNPIYLAMLKPGVRRGNSLANFGFGLDSGGFAINGSRSQDNLITFDGAVAIRTRSNGTSIGVADVDTVSEIQILTGNYGAEYGRAAGGQIRIVTKSGGQRFHGDFYEYFRNSELNANSWQRNQSATTNFVAPFRFNQFGYNVNGPVFIPGKWNKDRNKLFFLWGQEFIRYREATTVLRTVPSLAMRNGNFSELLGPNIYYSPQAINDPTTNTPFAGNIIPTARLSPNGIGLLRAYPEPTPGFLSGASNYIAAAGAPQNQRKDTISIDFNPAISHQFRFRHQNYNYDSYAPFDGNFDRVPRTFVRPNKTASLNYIWTLGPTMVNEFLATASVDRVRIGVDTSSGRFDRTQYGINYPYLFPERKEIGTRIPTITIPGVTELSGGPYPASSAGPIYVLSNNLTKISGNHTFKFGFLFERAGQNDFDQINVSGVPGGTNNQNGRFVFSDLRAGAPTSRRALSNAALGLFDTYAEIGVRSYTPYRGHMYEWFAQDGWKVTSRLKLEYGIRHSIIQPYYSLWGNMTVFDPRYYDQALAAPINPANGLVLTNDPRRRYNGVVIPGDSFPSSAKGRVPIADSGEFDFLFRGEPKQYSNIQKNLFQPRLGLAYSISQKQVIRSGIGRYSTRLGVSDSIFLGGNAPLQPLASISTGSVDNPGGGGGGSTNFPLSVNTQDKIFLNPESWIWNVTYERELPFSSTVELSYVGRKGLHAQRERNLNQLQPGTTFANPGVNVDSLRPYKGFGAIRITNNEASSLYNSFQVGLNRRFTQSFSYGFAYTLSKSSDNGSAQRDVIPNAFDAANLWGPSDFDTRHVTVINFIWHLPILRGNTNLAGKLLGGWQITGVQQFQTGTPGTAATGDDFAGVGTGSGSQIWNRTGEIVYSNQFSPASGDGNFWFQPRQSGALIYAEPGRGTFTTQRNRNALYAPGLQNWNLGLFKTFGIIEGHSLQFRFEAFNWINHPNLGGAGGGGLERNPRSANFGKVTTKGGERNLQLSLRYSF